jgi:twitching motility protein PilT
MPSPSSIRESDYDSFVAPHQELEIDKLFRACVKLEASDLHLKVGKPPMVRVTGTLRPMNRGPIDDEEMVRLCFPLMNERSRKIFDRDGGADFAHMVDVEGVRWRFRVNLLQQMGHIGMVARRVNSWIPDFEGLNLPPSIERLCTYDQGMILLAGVTGSGKSTTIASMIDYINERESVHIITIEDPIEYLFSDKKARINQREVGIDVPNFHDALKYLMREDPDIVLVGEMRDLETFGAAVHAAETGHLVFGTIHASSAAQTISRILDLFPAHERRAMRQALEFNLKSVICQKLIRSVHPATKIVPTIEVMVSNGSVRKLIREERDNELINVIRACYADGMIDFTEHLRRLVETGFIDHETAYEASPNPDELKMALKGIRTASATILS